MKRKKKKKDNYKIDNRQLRYEEAKSEVKRVFSKNKYFWLSGLCALYFLKYYNPVFAWFGALGALGFYKNSNRHLRKLTYICTLALFGLIGLFVN
ncbi:hypothetical protein GC105_05700 [Alkalibaculum sp. M08DMB]|uniref:Uncharacterized protein n=1 Tax=Alkalibaculum sporogenes TaxID=2655001 RepID=A0A6A7K7C3_9FIRM|nr:hypothetical protein [Alkalibaculum sporogenes]MPW25276.1 hypothetical protein [Alkalibaculum sporogenes]